MDYKKTYEEVLEKAKDLYEKEYYNFGKDDMTYLFPELAENEDEKKRKNITQLIVEHILAPKILLISLPQTELTGSFLIILIFVD